MFAICTCQGRKFCPAKEKKFALEKKNAGDAARFARNDLGQQKKHIYFLSTSS